MSSIQHPLFIGELRDIVEGATCEVPRALLNEVIKKCDDQDVRIAEMKKDEDILLAQTGAQSIQIQKLGEAMATEISLHNKLKRDHNRLRALHDKMASHETPASILRDIASREDKIEMRKNLYQSQRPEIESLKAQVACLTKKCDDMRSVICFGQAEPKLVQDYYEEFFAIHDTASSDDEYDECADCSPPHPCEECLPACFNDERATRLTADQVTKVQDDFRRTFSLDLERSACITATQKMLKDDELECEQVGKARAEAFLNGVEEE